MTAERTITNLDELTTFDKPSVLRSVVSTQIGTPIQETDHYPHLQPDSIYECLRDELIIHTEDEPFWSHKRMSASDLELADKGDKASATISEPEAKGSIRGTVGHTIGKLTAELFRISISEGKIEELFSDYNGVVGTQAPETPEDIQIIKAVAFEHAKKYRYIRSLDVPYMAHDIWKDLKDLYLFKYAKYNRKTIYEGMQYNSDWVYQYWKGKELGDFEGNLFRLFAEKADSCFGGDLFTQSGLLPIEWDTRFERSIEKPATIFSEFGKYRMQIRLQNDFVFDNTLAIDLKFGGHPEVFLKPVNRVQALLYSHAISHRNNSKNIVSEVSPNGAMFLIHWFDTQGVTPESHYVDATVYPHEYVQIIDKFCELTSTWNTNYEEFKQIKKARAWGIVGPFLAYPD